MASVVRDELESDLTVAMSDRDATRVAAIRTALAAIDNAEAVEGSEVPPGSGVYETELPRRMLIEEEVLAVVSGVRDELRDSASEMRRVGQLEEADRLERQVEVLDAYLS
jgi:uncharacterized protein YqeY